MIRTVSCYQEADALFLFQLGHMFMFLAEGLDCVCERVRSIFNSSKKTQ